MGSETLDFIPSVKQDLCCRFFEIFEKYDGYKDGHVKLKRPKQLQEILDIARSLLNEIQHRAADPEIEEKQGKLEQLKSVLEM
jgi:inositol hexakisphosphate/diphosphoinositol-pentakisphosphate kinase